MIPNFMAIGLTLAELWRFNGFFQNGGYPPSWILKTGTLTVKMEVLGIILRKWGAD